MSTRHIKIIIGSILIGVAVYLGYAYFKPKSVGNPVSKGSSSSDFQETQDATQSADTQKKEENTQEPAIQTLFTNLEIPWEIVFLPNDELLITQRTGTLLHITNDSTESIPVSGVEHVGEGGLLGLALHPNYSENNYIYLYLTSESDSGLINRVERYTFDEQQHSLSNSQVILDNIPGARYHDGGRIAFGPDGYLYITTGDAGDSELSQDTNSLAGKILRITDSGSIPEDNPFGNATFSFGHRNPQGIDWDSQNRLWSSEHGPSVITSGFDEVNLIFAGNNYGWPEITGDETQPNMLSPVIQSGSETTWAPADLAIYNDIVFFSGLRGQGLYSATIEGETLTNLKKHFDEEYGRIRAVVIDPTKQWLYFSTSNTDGRGDAIESDDRIIKVKLDLLESLSLTN